MSTIKIQATADSHGYDLPKINTQAKVFVHAGDMNGCGSKNYKGQFTNIRTLIENLYDDIVKDENAKIEEIFIVPGNHETILDTTNRSLYDGTLVHYHNMHYRIKLAEFLLEYVELFKELGVELHLGMTFSKIRYKGKERDTVKTDNKFIESKNLGRVLLIPFTPPVNIPESWGNVWENSDERQLELIDALKENDKVDVVISHGPPYGTADDIAGRTPNYKRAGDSFIKYLLDDFIKPKLFICGHIHEAHGYYMKEETGLSCDLYCVSHLNHLYQPVYALVPIEYKTGE